MKISKFLPVAAHAAIFALLIVSLGGCSDALTYSKEANRDGMSLYNDGNYTDAAGAFRHAVQQNPRDYKSFYYLGASYEAMKSYQQATEAYRSCLEVMPTTLVGAEDQDFHMRALDSLATAIAKSGNASFELAAVQKKLATNPDSEGWLLAAKISRYSGDADAALIDYEKAVRIDSTNFAIAKEAGLYQEQMGQSDKAGYSLRKAFAINDQDAQVNAALKRLGIVGGSTLGQSPSAQLSNN